jgi:hypothetical protein
MDEPRRPEPVTPTQRVPPLCVSVKDIVALCWVPNLAIAEVYVRTSRMRSVGETRLRPRVERLTGNMQ